VLVLALLRMKISCCVSDDTNCSLIKDLFSFYDLFLYVLIDIFVRPGLRGIFMTYEA
jgi:hypothetical protein